VREERRLGLESTPTGLIEEDFSSMFWKSSSYHWEVIGWPSDLGSITKEQADNYFDLYYAPNNLTMILVGDLNPEELIKTVRQYFDRIPRGKVPPPEVVTLEEKQYGEKRLTAEAETTPKTTVAYHTVAWKHSDSYPLEVLAGIMSDKTGRLYKKLVEEKGIAKSSGGGGPRMFGGGGMGVNAAQDSRKYAGAFQISAEGISGVKAEQLEQAIYEVVEDLKTNLVPEPEIQKVKNQLKVQGIRFMDMMSGIGILFYLGSNAALGDWAEANNNPVKRDLVTAEDIKRVANTYLVNDQRNVLIINSKTAPGGEGGAEAEDPQFAQAVAMVKSMKDPIRLEQMIGMMSGQMDRVTDPNEKAQMEKLLKIASDHLATLKAAESK
jgi:predicted Zn-dependent peptidase